LKVIVFLVLLTFSVVLEAKGVKAGTVITNQATLDFSMGDGASFSIKSNEVKNIVSQVLNFVLEWQNSKPVEIYKGAKQKILNLSLKNEGNGKDNISIDLAKDSSLDAFVESMQLYADTNKNGVLDKEDSVLSSLFLEADQEMDIFLVTSMKDDVYSQSSHLDIKVSAKSNLGGSGEKGTVHVGKGVDGVDAVDGISGGVSSKDVYYELRSQKPTFKKSVEYFKDRGYYLVTLELDIKGNTTLKNLVLTDRMPLGLRYRKNSIKFNKKYQSDKKDSDFASFDFRVNRLTLNLAQLKLPNKVMVTYILDKEVR